MADVSRPLAGDAPRGGRTRGQLILVGGFVVAVALVGLVVLLNTVLFAENISTRGADPGGERVFDHAAFAQDAGATVLRAEDRPKTEPDTWPEARSRVAADVARVGGIATNRSLQHRSAYTNLSVNRTTRGAVLVQNGSGTLVSDSGTATWTLANTSGVRRFTTTLDATRMSTDEFEVAIEGRNGTWRAAVSSTTSDTVRVSAAGTDCFSTSSKATINWTEGRLGDCSFPFALDGGSRLEQPLTVRIVDGTDGYGTYSLVVADENGTAVRRANFADPGTGRSPRWYPAVYSLVLDARYEDEGTTYETTVRAAPGEPPRTRPVS